MNGFKLHASQLRAMLVRNITLKFREKRKLLWVSSSIDYSFTAPKLFETFRTDEKFFKIVIGTI